MFVTEANEVIMTRGKNCNDAYFVNDNLGSKVNDSICMMLLIPRCGSFCDVASIKPCMVFCELFVHVYSNHK